MLRKRWADRADLNRCSVFPKPLLMPTGQAQTSERAGVEAQLVGDQQFRHEALLLEQLAHQPQRGATVASALDQYVENLALVIDGAPQIPSARRRCAPPSRPSGRQRLPAGEPRKAGQKLSRIVPKMRLGGFVTAGRPCVMPLRRHLSTLQQRSTPQRKNRASY